MPEDPSSVPGENFRISRSAWQDTKDDVNGFFFLHVTLTIKHVATIRSSLAAQRSWQGRGVLNKQLFHAFVFAHMHFVLELTSNTRRGHLVNENEGSVHQNLLYKFLMALEDS